MSSRSGNKARDQRQKHPLPPKILNYNGLVLYNPAAYLDTPSSTSVFSGIPSTEQFAVQSQIKTDTTTSHTKTEPWVMTSLPSTSEMDASRLPLMYALSGNRQLPLPPMKESATPEPPFQDRRSDR